MFVLNNLEITLVTYQNDFKNNKLFIEDIIQ